MSYTFHEYNVCRDPINHNEWDQTENNYYISEKQMIAVSHCCLAWRHISQVVNIELLIKGITYSLLSTSVTYAQA